MIISKSRTGSRSLKSLMSTRCAISRVRSTMLQETCAEPGAFVRAFDQSRHIGHDEGSSLSRHRARIGGNYAKIRLERRKRVRGDLWTRGGNARNQSGLAGIWKTDQTHVREQFQFEPQFLFFAGLSVFVFARSLMPGLGEFRIAVAASAVAAARRQIALAGLRSDRKALRWCSRRKSRYRPELSESDRPPKRRGNSNLRHVRRAWLRIRDCSGNAAGCCRWDWPR